MIRTLLNPLQATLKATLLAVFLIAFSFNATAAADANRASQAELESIKGIGPGLSGKILKARQTAEFKSWGDLVERVGGIGPGNASRFSQAGLTVSGAAYEDQATTIGQGSKAGSADKAKRSAKAEGAEPKARKSKKADQPQA